MSKIRILLFVISLCFTKFSVAQDLILRKKFARHLTTDTLSMIISARTLSNLEDYPQIKKKIEAFKKYYNFPYQIVVVDFPENFHDGDPLPYNKDDYISLHYYPFRDLTKGRDDFGHTVYINLKGKNSRLGTILSEDGSNPDYAEMIEQLNAQIKKKTRN